jgi:hypothetical protein
MKKKIQAIFLQTEHWSSFSQKNCPKIDQKMLPRLGIKHQITKQNCCTSNQPWQHLVWLNATSNQQSRSTNLSSKIIGNSQYNFIWVDPCLVASFPNLVEIPHHSHIDYGNWDFETEVEGIITVA